MIADPFYYLERWVDPKRHDVLAEGQVLAQGKAITNSRPEA